MNFRRNLFLTESIIFLMVQALGLYVGLTLFQRQVIQTSATGSSVISFLISFSIATIVLILLLKFLKGKFMFKFLLAFLIFIGSETVFGTFIPEEAAILIAFELVLLRFLVPNVLTQNLVMIFAIAGIGATLGLMFSLEAVLIILAILSVYDVIAVYRTKHMVSMFSGLIKKGVPFSLVIPDKITDIKESLKDAQPGTGRFLLLGTGDVAFPIIFAVSALKYGLFASISVIIGAFVGIFFIHLILLQKKYGAIPALPPIVMFSLLAFIINLVYTGVL